MPCRPGIAFSIPALINLLDVAPYPSDLAVGGKLNANVLLWFQFLMTKRLCYVIIIHMTSFVVCVTISANISSELYMIKKNQIFVMSTTFILLS